MVLVGVPVLIDLFDDPLVVKDSYSNHSVMVNVYVSPINPYKASSATLWCSLMVASEWW